MNTKELSQIFYKITNKNENHYGFQYQDGLNVLVEPFNSNSQDTCCAGGLYFTDIENIFKFISYGCNVREITLPFEDSEFQIVKDPNENKWRANKIILGKKYDLWKKETIQMLIERGANINVYNDFPLVFASLNGFFEIVIYLIENGANIHAGHDSAIRSAHQYAHSGTIKYLAEKGVSSCQR